MSQDIKHIVIVGGGTAGWMTGAALSHLLPMERVKITLIESDQIGTIGVGEATLPNIAEFNNILGIPEAKFMAATSATIKYGIEFVGWSKEGERYFHPFGEHGIPMGGFPFHQYWRRAQKDGAFAPIQNHCMTAQAALQGKAASPSRNPDSPLSMLSHAYQFDSAKYALFLRDYAQANGLMRQEGKVVSVGQNDETGFITDVSLESGKKISGDLFIDCSGFRALLLSQTLECNYQDWSEYLPVNCALTAQTEKSGPALPYTRCTAKRAGWQWRIPLQHRTGNGYVFSNKYTNDNEAETTFLEGLDGKRLTDVKKIKFTTGQRATFWEKNCIGIGLSCGFLEPLESTSIYLIQTGIKLLISLFPDASCSEFESKEYNTLMGREFEQIRDFLMLHYVINERHGEPFWDYMRHVKITDTLQQKMDLFSKAGRFFRYEGDLFSETSWVAVMMGQGLFPESYNQAINTMPDNVLHDTLGRLEKGIAMTVSKMPDHETFLKQIGATTPHSAMRS